MRRVDVFSVHFLISGASSANASTNASGANDGRFNDDGRAGGVMTEQ